MSTPAVQLRRVRAMLAEGFISEAFGLLNELCQLKEKLAGAGPELASAESYGISADYRALFQDRIDLVNIYLRGDA